MSWKGHVFKEEDLSEREVNAAKASLGESFQEWLDTKLATMTERYRIVATDPDTNESIIAEELDQRAINKLPDTVRSIAGSIASLPLEQRVTVLEAFNADGSIAYPFDMVE